MAARKPALGKGLESLIPNRQAEKNGAKKEASASSEKKAPAQKKTAAAAAADSASGDVSKENILEMDILKVEPNREQPRKHFDEDGILELADSIKRYGVLSPLLVQKRDGYYEIVAGERRWRAAKRAGLKKVPVIIRDLSEREIVEIALIENIQREDLNPIEEAQAYRRLLEEFSLSQDEVAERVSKSRPTITNSRRLLNLDERVQQMLMEDLISAGHARALLGLEDKDAQYELAQRVLDEKLSVRNVEAEVRKANTKRTAPVEPALDPKMRLFYETLEESLKGKLGTKVRILPKDNRKGKLEIEYYSQDDLERIIDQISRPQP